VRYTSGAQHRSDRPCACAVRGWVETSATVWAKGWALAIAVAVFGIQALHLLELIDIDQSIYLAGSFGRAGAVAGVLAVWALKDDSKARTMGHALPAIVIGATAIAGFAVTGHPGANEFEPQPLQSVSYIMAARTQRQGSEAEYMTVRNQRETSLQDWKGPYMTREEMARFEQPPGEMREARTAPTGATGRPRWGNLPAWSTSAS
jgi:hypothetical protein